MRILNAGFYAAAQDVDFPPHSHTEWELVYYRSGRIGCRMGNRQYPGHVGLAWLTPPRVIHSEQAITDYSCYYVALASEVPLPWPTFLDDDADGSLGRVCQQIALENGKAAPFRERMLELLAGQLSLLLDRIASEKVLSPTVQTVIRAEQWIDARCMVPLTIEQVAKGIGVSTSTLRAHFKSVRGCPPRSHLQRMRVERAIRLLRTSSLKLEAVAELCGYDSASHLTRSVKKFTRQTPGRLRAREP